MVEQSGGNDFFERLQYGYNNAPKTGSGFMDFMKPLLWAMGRPDSLIPGQGLAQHFFNQAIARGQNPMDVIPGMKPPAAATPAAPAEDPRTKGLAPWYVDWLKTSGRNGGVPPVRGLL